VWDKPVVIGTTGKPSFLRRKLGIYSDKSGKMESLQASFLKALVEKFPHAGLTAVLEGAPEEYASKFRVLPDRSGIAPELFLSSPERLLKGLHPSWIDEILVSRPEALRPVLRTALAHEESLPPTLRSFLLAYFVERWPDRTTLPVEFIGETSLIWLASCDDHTLTTLAELVAVPEGVDIVRHIVDKKMLQKIMAPLNVFQQRYLRSLLHRPVRTTVLNKELMELLIHDAARGAEFLRTKGFEILGAALKQEPPLLVWHVLHHLNRDRALWLQKEMGKAVSDEKQEEAKRNLMHAYQFLKKVEPS
jgi:hypothetical protein